MSNMKKKVLVIALCVCLLSTVSFGTLAWFTDSDFVTNDFYIANSADDPDEIFSVDVWEDATPEDPDGEDKLDGITYENILPGDDLYKEVNIENTGSYDQYVRAFVTVTDASVWLDVFGEVYPTLNALAPVNGLFEEYSIVYNADLDVLTYVYYYTQKLAVDEVVTMIQQVLIPEELDRYQAAELAGSFSINVFAQAVQTENVGDNAIEAFKTVGMDIPAGNRIIMETAEGLNNVLATGLVSPVVLNDNFADKVTEINVDVEGVTIDANGTNAGLKFTGFVEDVTITNIKDDIGGASNYVNVSLKGAEAGSSVTVKDSSFVTGRSPDGWIESGAINVAAYVDLTVENCTFESDGTAYGIYSFNSGALTFKNCDFKNFDKWVIMINGTSYGDAKFVDCTFTECSDGLFKTSVKGSDHNGLHNGDFIFTNNLLTDCQGHDGKEAQMFKVLVVGDIFISDNTRDSEDWTPDSTYGIVKQ